MRYSQVLPTPDAKVTLARNAAMVVAALFGSMPAAVAAFGNQTQNAATATGATEISRLADLQVSLVLARALGTSGDPAGSASIFRQLAARSDATQGLRLEFANALIAAALYDEAIGVLDALTLDPKVEGEALLGLARVQLKFNRHAEALTFAERSVRLDPTNVGGRIICGIALDRAGRHFEAQAHYRAALVVAPRNRPARNDLALSLALSGNQDEAIAIMIPIARSANASAGDRQNLAFVYGLKGDSAAALALGRVDLDENTAQANARFYALAARATE